jgi:hypothetical protein
MHIPCRLSLYGQVRANFNLNITAPHVLDRGFKLSTPRFATEQCDYSARLHAQDLHMQRSTGGQLKNVTCLQRAWAMESGHE